MLIYKRGRNIERDRLGSLLVPGLQQKTMAFMQEMLNLVKVFLNGSFFLNTEVTDAVATVGLFTGF